MEEIFDKLQAVADRYDELNELISDPEVIADSQRFMKLSKEEGSLRETVEKYNQYKATRHPTPDELLKQFEPIKKIDNKVKKVKQNGNTK